MTQVSGFFTRLAHPPAAPPAAPGVFAFALAVPLAIALALGGCARSPTAPPGSPPKAEAPASLPAVPKRPPRIGLALGGGAARGIAHIGVIQVLEEAGIRPSLVVGTSAGSLVAAIYASDKNGAQLQVVAETMEEVTITDWTLPIFSRGRRVS